MSAFRLGSLAVGKQAGAYQAFARDVIKTAQIIDEDQAGLYEQAFASVDRAAFLPPEQRNRCFEDVSLPIGFDQCSVRPSVLARVMAVAGVGKGCRVLELGSGSGYSSAVMSTLGASVFSVERIGLLAQQTRKRLDGLYYQNVLVRRADGQRGWHEHAPYDSIIQWYPTDRIDPEILSQLVTPEGRLVAPLGRGDSVMLTLWKQQGEHVAVYQLEQWQGITP